MLEGLDRAMGHVRDLEAIVVENRQRQERQGPA